MLQENRAITEPIKYSCCFKNCFSPFRNINNWRYILIYNIYRFKL